MDEASGDSGPQPQTPPKEYSYRKLEHPEDIRLITILPGDYDDDIVIQISHARLPASDEQPTVARMTLEEVTATLPPDWKVDEAWDGRYIFFKIIGSWVHPDESFDHSRYQKPTHLSSKRHRLFKALRTLTRKSKVEPAGQRMTLGEVAATLPLGWAVQEAPDGRYYFYRLVSTTWVHPGDSFDHSRYQKPVRITRPEYEALSYAWGSNELTENLYIWMGAQDETASTLPSSRKDQCKGDIPPCHTYLRITRNLETALRHLRGRTSKRTLWADGICINQNDTDEKNMQVPRMGEVFKMAQTVVVWLGREENNSGLALDTLEHLGKQLVYTHGFVRLRAPEAIEPLWYRPETELPFSREAWMAITYLLRRQWFNRQWIVQEIQLAENAVLYCGQRSMNWTYFRYALQSLEQRKHLPSYVSRHCLAFAIMCRHSSTNLPVSVMLHDLWQPECGDPRDRVYSLLGLFSPRLRDKIRPRYDESHTAVHVYKETFLAHTRYFHRLELFARCLLSKSQIFENGPYWVPDLSSIPEAAGFLNQFAAGFSGCWTKMSSESSDIFTVAGVRCATVNTIGSLLPRRHQENDPLLLAIRELAAKELGANKGHYPTGEPFKEAFAKTLCLNRLQGRFPAFPDYPDLKSWLRHKSTYAFFGNDKTDHIAGEQVGPSSYEDNLMGCLQGLRYVTTEEGYIGFGPPDVDEGEWYLLLFEISSPHFLFCFSQKAC